MNQYEICGVPRTEILTPRMHEILRLMAEGYTYLAIGRELGIAYGTIKSTLHGLDAWPGLYARLGAANAPNAVHIAHQRGILW